MDPPLQDKRTKRRMLRKGAGRKKDGVKKHKDVKVETIGQGSQTLYSWSTNYGLSYIRHEIPKSLSGQNTFPLLPIPPQSIEGMIVGPDMNKLT